MSSSIVFGLLAHGYSMTNQIQFHDDVASAFDFGPMFTHGRWANYILLKLFRFFLGGDVVSLAFFNTLTAILLLALMAAMILRILKIENPRFAAAIGGMIIVFPPITSVLGYRFMAYTYAFAYLLTVLGVYLITNTKLRVSIKVISFIVLQTFAMGIYQATIPFFLSLIVLYLFRRSVDEDSSWKVYWIRIVKWASVCVASTITYLAITFGLNSLKGIQLSSYQNIRGLGLGQGLVADYPRRLLLACWRIIVEPINAYGDMYPMSIRLFYYILLAIAVALALLLLANVFRQSRSKGYQCIILLCGMPLSINFIYVMCGEGSFIYALMEFSKIFIFICPCLFMELAVAHSYLTGRQVKNFKKSVLIVLGIMGFLYIRLANLCYLKAEYVQTRAISYFTVLQTRIQGVPGYKESYPLIFVNENNKSHLSVACTTQLQNINIHPYSDSVINNHAWKQFMALWVGYAPEVLGVEVLKNPHEVENMPHYPNEGSIQIIEGKIVVNF